jgi:hypothetical protein
MFLASNWCRSSAAKTGLDSNSAIYLMRAKMNYSDGTHVMVGDVVELWDGLSGKVLCILDEQQAVEGFVMLDWIYLGKGIIVETDTAGLVHYEKQGGEIKLVGK